MPPSTHEDAPPSWTRRDMHGFRDPTTSPFEVSAYVYLVVDSGASSTVLRFAAECIVDIAIHTMPSTRSLNDRKG